MQLSRLEEEKEEHLKNVKESCRKYPF
jgi:hypothetical protein